MMQMLLTVCVGYVGYKIARLIKIPAPGMVGSMIGVGAMNVLIGKAYLPTEVKLLTQAISGAFIGVQVFREDLLEFKNLLKPILLLVLMLTMNTLLSGIIIVYVSGIDLATALLSCVAGGVTDMALISLDMGADTSVVALLQLVRLVGTMMFFPMWIQWMTRKEKEKEITPLKQSFIKNETRLNIFLNKFLKSKKLSLLFTLSITLLAGYIGYMINMPSAVLVCSMVLVACANCLTMHAYMPNSIRIAAQICAGSLVGCSVNRETVLGLSQLILPALILLLGYLLVNYMFGIICAKCKLLDYKSALFASSPAGVSDMALIAGDLGADMKKTSIIQVFRLIYAIGIMPILIQLLIGFL